MNLLTMCKNYEASCLLKGLSSFVIQTNAVKIFQNDMSCLSAFLAA